MAHQVEWSRKVLTLFEEEALLTEDEIFIMETRIKNWSVTEQANHLNKSESTVHKMIALLKKKYDNAQKLHPNEMPVRKFSAK